MSPIVSFKLTGFLGAFLANIDETDPFIGPKQPLMNNNVLDPLESITAYGLR